MAGVKLAAAMKTERIRATFAFCIRCGRCGKALRPRKEITIEHGGGLTVLLPRHRCRAASVRKIRRTMKALWLERQGKT